VDAILGYYTSQPIALEGQGITPTVFLLADHGYTLYESVYIVDERELDAKRDAVVGFMRGEQRGWQENLDNPALGVDLTISTFGADSGLDKATQARQNESQNRLIRPAAGRMLLGMDDAGIAANLELLRSGLGINVDDSLFDTSVLATL
jgi:ABC-type nitrate/sulfonate/bicarbonate transport system substrate-binding protein